MNEAILVTTSLPLVIGSGFGQGHKEQQFVQQLNEALQAAKMNWHVSLDDTFGDSQAIQQKQPQALILKNGLQRQFDHHNFDSNRIYQLDALTLSTLSTKSVVNFLAKLSA